MDAGNHDLIARRIQREGRDVLYIHDSQGKSVGQVDLKTGITVLDQPTMRAAFHRVIDAWRRKHIVRGHGGGRGVSGARGAGVRGAGARGTGHGAGARGAGTHGAGGGRAAQPARRRGSDALAQSIARIREQEAGRGSHPRLGPGRNPVDLGKPSPPQHREREAKPADRVPPSLVKAPAPDLVDRDQKHLNAPHRKPALAQALSARLGAMQRYPLDTRNDLSAAEAGRRLVARLGRLGSEWRLIDRAEGGWEADEVQFILAGPRGVFGIAPKFLLAEEVRVANDTIRVGGRHVKFIPRLRAEVDRLAGQLSASCGFTVEMIGVLAVTGARELALVPHPPDVGVVQLRRLPRWLAMHSEVFQRETAEVIAEHAGNRETWHASAA